MMLQKLPRSALISVANTEFHSGAFPNAAQGALSVKVASEEFVSKLLNRRWALSRPDTKINQIIVSDRDNRGSGDVLESVSFINNPKPSLGDDMMEKDQRQPSFYVVRDDLLHPLVNGNKARKLDALLPLLEDYSVTDVVTCGGCQSAHAAAVAVSCAERGLRSRLLLRGEQPLTLTGYNLISTLYGNVTYIPRSLYAKREDMLLRHANLLAGNTGLVLHLDDLLADCFKNDASRRQNYLHTDAVQNIKKVAIINEGAGDSVALLGVIRLVHCLAQDHLFGNEQAMKIVIDAGTGTTAVGVALGAMLLGLPWEVTAVMLADTIDGYKKKEESLISEFCTSCTSSLSDKLLNRMNDGIVHWVKRRCPRKFGNILEREVQECQKIAQQTGVSVDPVYTLAAWELATSLSQDDAGDAQVVMLHTGGTLGMFGLAQRYRSYFQNLDEGISN